MMQSNADFIENFSQKTTPLQELTQNKTHFKWTPKHQRFFEQLLKNFRKDTLFRYFDMKKNIYIFTDTHISGLGAILTQVDNYHNAKPIIIASQTTSQSLCFTSTSFAPHLFLLGWLRLNLALLLDQWKLA